MNDERQRFLQGCPPEQILAYENGVCVWAWTVVGSTSKPDLA